MIEYSYQTDFELSNQDKITKWIEEIIEDEGYVEGDIGYVFCDDRFLHSINKEFLNHDTLTDIISFDYSLGKQIHGEIYISIERVAENAVSFNCRFEEELHRVIIHGILHYCGYEDKTKMSSEIMRQKENTCLALRKFI